MNIRKGKRKSRARFAFIALGAAAVLGLSGCQTNQGQRHAEKRGAAYGSDHAYGYQKGHAFYPSSKTGHPGMLRFKRKPQWVPARPSGKSPISGR